MTSRTLTPLTLLLLLLLAASAAPAPAAEPAPPAPRVVTLTGETYPAAEIISVDPATGVVTYAYLKANGTRADTGNSIAKFAPVAPLPKAQPSDPDEFPAISDATLVAAISSAS